jgi:hypothetical protein
LFPLFATCFLDTGDKFATGVVNIGGEMTVLLFSGDWGKMIHKKTYRKKSRDTVSLKGLEHDMFFLQLVLPRMTIGKLDIFVVLSGRRLLSFCT